ncbi:MAG TPA: hypothetical protein VFE50_01650 [Cyclobacteriaceae bacterium]|nr:hypothetical protein [Cyclobacteriaceae bacterium]
MRSYKNLILVVTLVAFFSCDDTEPTNCVVKEAILRTDGQISGKEVYIHDGTNFIESRSYRYDAVAKKFQDEPMYITTYTYNSDGRIAVAKEAGSDNVSFSQQEFTYSGNPIVNVTVRQIRSYHGGNVDDVTYDFKYVESPQDCVYHFSDHVEEYKNGNLVRVEWPDNKLEYKYDNEPNVAKHFPFFKTIVTTNFGRNRNNLLEELATFSGGSYSRKYSFAFYGNGQLNIWNDPNVMRSVSFVYDCK